MKKKKTKIYHWKVIWYNIILIHSVLRKLGIIQY